MGIHLRAIFVIMTLEAIRYQNGTLEILDQLLLPGETKYIPILGVEDGWKAINKMQVSYLHSCWSLSFFFFFLFFLS